MQLRSPLLAVALTTLVSLTGAAGALGDVATSSNWAGYAVHRSGVSFSRVVGSWIAPSATCRPGHPTYSSTWIGIGGFRTNSRALEQTGTEADCTASGRQVSSAWMEIVPAPAHTISVRVSPGDAIAASVSISGHQVTLGLEDVRTHQLLERTVRATYVDLSSAEWIVEAPSACRSATNCRTLPLANFGTAQIGVAVATTTTGHSGAISDPAWGVTRIQLKPSAAQLVHVSSSTAGGASPSDLTANGSAFDVVYANVLLAGGDPFSAVSHLAHRAG